MKQSNPSPPQQPMQILDPRQRIRRPPGESPYSEWEIGYRGEVITWQDYLSEETRSALLDLHALERLDQGLEAFWRWEETQPLRERLRIYHFEWTYRSYTEPECPTFCVWLTGHEIRTRLFRSAVPPFAGGEYQSSQRHAIKSWAADPAEIPFLVAEENYSLLASQRWWTQEHFAVVQLYRTLPYDIDQQQLHGRWVESYLS